MEKEKKYGKFFAIFKRVVCSWSFITTEKRKQSPFFFCLKSGKKETNISPSFNLIQTKRKKSLYLAAIIFFACFPFFHFSLTESFQTSFCFLAWKLLNDMLGMNQGTNSKKLKYHFYWTNRKVEDKHWTTNITKFF